MNNIPWSTPLLANVIAEVCIFLLIVWAILANRERLGIGLLVLLYLYVIALLIFMPLPEPEGEMVLSMDESIYIMSRDLNDCRNWEGTAINNLQAWEDKYLGLQETLELELERVQKHTVEEL